MYTYSQLKAEAKIEILVPCNDDGEISVIVRKP